MADEVTDGRTANIPAEDDRGGGGQKLLEQLLALRADLVCVQVTMDKGLVSMRGKISRPAEPMLPPFKNDTHTVFSSAAKELVAEIAGIVARVKGQAEEFAGWF